MYYRKFCLTMRHVLVTYVITVQVKFGAEGEVYRALRLVVKANEMLNFAQTMHHTCKYNLYEDSDVLRNYIGLHGDALERSDACHVF
jgi:hypothetical protein